MEKIYQVFVSSTYEDLQEERKEVMQALLELDCMPAGMELFPASNDDQWTLIKRVIDACDYYLLIVGGRYGSVNEKGISYTQMEFEYALEIGKPIISFLPKNPENIPSGKCEKDIERQKKLEEFKEKAKKKLVKYWENPEHLGSIVSRSMIKLIKDFPAEGWVKACSAIDEKSVKEIARLQKENSELQKRLTEIAFEAPKGAEVLSQGEDEVLVGFSFEAYHAKKHSYYRLSRKIMCTWNSLFMAISPHLISEAPERTIVSALNSHITKNVVDIVSEEKKNGYSQFSDLKIEDSSYNIIKIQLKALGLICLSEKKRQVSDKGTYWKLTPYGETFMTQLLAIRK